METIGGTAWKASTFDGHVVSMYDTILWYIPTVGQAVYNVIGCWALRGALETVEEIAKGHVEIGNQVRNQVQTICTLKGFKCAEDELALPDFPGYGPVNLVVQSRKDEVQIRFVQTQLFDIRKEGSNNVGGYLAVISGDGYILMNVHKGPNGIGVCTRVNPPAAHTVTMFMQDRVNPPFLDHDKDRLNLECNIEFDKNTVQKIVEVLDSWK